MHNIQLNLFYFTIHPDFQPCFIMCNIVHTSKTSGKLQILNQNSQKNNEHIVGVNKPDVLLQGVIFEIFLYHSGNYFNISFLSCYTSWLT